MAGHLAVLAVRASPDPAAIIRAPTSQTRPLHRGLDCDMLSHRRLTGSGSAGMRDTRVHRACSSSRTDVQPIHPAGREAEQAAGGHLPVRVLAGAACTLVRRCGTARSSLRRRRIGSRVRRIAGRVRRRGLVAEGRHLEAAAGSHVGVVWPGRREDGANVHGMATWVFCNRCFQPPRRTACFSLTSCGHVYCAGCLSKCAWGSGAAVL